MSQSNGTVMGGAMPVPLVLEVPCADGKTVATVRVADLKSWSGYGFSFGHQETEFASDSLDNREQSDGTVPN